jgi:hypothetical protein
MKPTGWRGTMTGSQHVYEVRPRQDHRGVDLISNALPFGRLWYSGPNAVSNAIGYANHYSRSHDAVIRVYDEAGNLVERHEHAISKSSEKVQAAILRKEEENGRP